MITIVEVTGYIFGFPTGTNSIGSSARGITSMITAPIGSTFVKYLQQVRAEGTGLSTSKLFTVSNLKDVNKFAGIRTAIVGSYLPPSEFRWDFAGLTTPRIQSFFYTSKEDALDKILFSFVNEVPIYTTNWYYDTEQQKISSISVSGISSQKTLQEVFTLISCATVDRIGTTHSMQDSTVFSLGSGLNTNTIISADARELISDFSQTLYSGMNLATILSGITVSWKDPTSGVIIEAKLIQFWS
jgi:hypothetical protein